MSVTPIDAGRGVTPAPAPVCMSSVAIFNPFPRSCSSLELVSRSNRCSSTCVFVARPRETTPGTESSVAATCHIRKAVS